MTQDPGARLDRLPDELLLDIIEQSSFSACGKYQFWVLSRHDAISFACTSRRHYRLAIDTAYKIHVKEENGLAIYWAIENKQFGTLKRLVENGVDVNMRVGKGNEYYTSLRYHKTHCSYQWRKMHRAMERGTKIENKLADYHHTMHCGLVQMQQGDMEDLMTKITVELMTC